MRGLADGPVPSSLLDKVQRTWQGDTARRAGTSETTALGAPGRWFATSGGGGLSHPPDQHLEYRMIDDKTLTKTLAALGRTGNGVKERLVKAGARGVVGEPDRCAVAQYLHTVFPDETVIRVDGSEVQVNGATVPTPAAVETFIAAFDDHDYPELVEHVDDCGGITVLHDADFDGTSLVRCGCGRIWREFSPWHDEVNYKAQANGYAKRARKAFVA